MSLVLLFTFVPPFGEPHMTRKKLLVIAFAVTLATLAYLGVTSSDSHQQAGFSIQHPTPEVETQKAFWAAHLDQVIRVELMASPSTYRIKEIRERYATLAQEIETRYGRIMGLCPITNYNEKSHDILAGCSMTYGLPRVELVIPLFMEKFETYQMSGNSDWEERFELLAVLSVMHEMEHIALGQVEEGNPEISFEKLVENEKAAWANTCQFSIGPLVEIYQAPISSSDMLYYNDWIACGKNPDSQAWDKAIRGAYETERE